MDLTNTSKLIIASIYYIIVGALALFSTFGVYILIRYGRTIPVSVLVSTMYVIFFATSLLASYSTLRSVLNS